MQGYIEMKLPEISWQKFDLIHPSVSQTLDSVKNNKGAYHSLIP